MKSQITLSSLCSYDEDEDFGSVLTVEPHPFNKSTARRTLCTETLIVKEKYAHAYFSFCFDHTPYLPPMPVIADVVKWRVGE